jgi:Dimethlysulfonioproprionate lyase
LSRNRKSTGKTDAAGQAAARKAPPGLEALVGLLTIRLSAIPVLAARFAPLLAMIRELPMTATPHSRSLAPIPPVARHWDAAVGSDLLGPVSTALKDVTPWQQTASYRASPPSPNFLDNYGYLEFVGPDAPFQTDAARLGLLLLGPGTLYPLHRHAAEELYFPLGEARWLREDDDWRLVADGGIIHHPPFLGHATESLTAPLAAIYLWLGDIGPAAELD